MWLGPRVDRRQLLKMLGAGTATVSLAELLAACGGSAGNASGGASSSVDSQLKKELPLVGEGKLSSQNIATAFFSGPEGNSVRALAPQFNQLTGGKVNASVYVAPETSLLPSILSMWQSHGTQYDATWMNAANLLNVADSGFVVPLDEYIKRPWVNPNTWNLGDYPEPILSIFKNKKGQLLALPVEVSGYFQFVNKELMEHYGNGHAKLPPKQGYTWDAFIENARTIQEGINSKGQTGKIYATAHIFEGGPGLTDAGDMYEQTVRSYGYVPWTSNGFPRFNGDVAVEAMQMLHDLVFKYKVASPGVTGYEYAQIVTLINEGTTVMPLQWDASATPNEDATQSRAAGQLAFAPFPYHSSAGPNVSRIYPSAHAWTVNAASPKRDAALEFVYWYTSEQVGKMLARNGGGDSGRSSVLNDPSIDKKNAWYPALFQSFKQYFSFPPQPFYNALIIILGQALVPEWTAGGSVKRALDKAQSDATAFLKQQGFSGGG